MDFSINSKSRPPVEGDRRAWVPSDEPPSVKRGESLRANFLDRRLLAGFSRPALKELERLRVRSNSVNERVAAGWALARWHASLGNHQRALEYIEAARQSGITLANVKVSRLIESECLRQIGRSADARRILEEDVDQTGGDCDFSLGVANCISEQETDLRLRWINQPLVQAGMAPVERSDTAAPLTVDNLQAPGAPSIDDPTRVTVIVPVFNAADTITMALGSLTQQTWTNLEIIVVDDCSTDSTFDIVQALARRDTRIVPVRHERNLGVYSARNTGLKVATGDLVTTHDSDDWSHPQKIASQVAAMQENPNLVGSRSHWARATRSLIFVNSWLPGDPFVVPNFSSFMFTQELLDAAGRWDRVRISADAELIDRCTAIFGRERFTDILPHAPLSFSLWEADTLTRSPETNIRTVLYGVRRDYADAARWWHRQLGDKGSLRLDPADERRPFAAPVRMLPGKTQPRRYDLLLVADLNRSDSRGAVAADWVRRAVAVGARIAVFHWPQFDSAAGPLTNRSVWELASGGKLDVLSAGDEASARVVVVSDPSILRHPIDDPPMVEVEHLLLAGANLQTSSVESTFAAGVAWDVFGVSGVSLSEAEAEKRIFSLVGPDHRAFPAVGERRGKIVHLLSFDPARLEEQRQLWRRGDAAIRPAIEQLLTAAGKAMSRERLSVVDKKTLPPSGDPHDYFSVAPYWWPNPETPDGLPFIHRDGMRVPETILFSPSSERYDRSRAERLFEDTVTLALATYFSDDRRYAVKAIANLETWFVDPATRMNPHLRYGQVRRGHGLEGDPAGVIEFVGMSFLVDALRLLALMDTLPDAIEHAVRGWFRNYLAWLRESSQGAHEDRARNNHGIAYDMQVLTVANYLGDRAEVDDRVARACGRIGEHFARDGSEPFELARTISKHYCAFNLQLWANLARAAGALGFDLWHFQAPSGVSLREGFLWFFGFQGEPWPFQQIAAFDESRVQPLYEAYRSAYGSLPQGVAEPFSSPADTSVSAVGVRAHWRLG